MADAEMSDVSPPIGETGHAAPPINTNMGNGFVMYVRECYPTYYEKIQAKFAETKHKKSMITVTGTPGIGKSIFYLYYFERYRTENPDKKVLTASFTRGQELIECFVWNSLNEIAAGADSCITLTKLPDKDNAPCELYLYDGSPKVDPPETVKMVAFSSPNKNWLEEARKKKYHLTVYMPKWTAAELEDANLALKIGLTKTEIEEKMSLFGGTARYTLTKDESFFKTGRKALVEALGNIETFDQVSRCFAGNMDLHKIVHRLMHYVVDENDWEESVLKPASKLVATLMHEQLRKKLGSERENLLWWLDGAGKGSVFSAWLFENLAHEKLFAGDNFQLREITSGKLFDLIVPATSGHYKRFKVEVPLEQALLNSLQIPQASNLQSIDSYILSGGRLFLFQMTMNHNHDVDLEGLVNILKYLKLEEKVMADPNFAAIIFVVPIGMRDDFKKQKISKPAVFENKSRPQILSADCGEMPGIGPQKKIKLEKLSIKTIGELLAAYEADKEGFSLVKHAVEKFKVNMTQLQEAEKLREIPQYVAGLRYNQAEATKPKKEADVVLSPN